MYAIFPTKEKAELILNQINTIKTGNKDWVRDGITNYANLIELETGYALPILPGYQYFFMGIPQRKKEHLPLKINNTLI